MNKPEYTYCYAYGKWRVNKMTYIGTSSYGDKIAEYYEKSEAVAEVYRLNGWKPKKAPQH